MKRRDFLKFFGIGLSAAIAGSVGLSRPVRGDETSYLYLPAVFNMTPGGWYDITIPDGVFSWVPFVVQGNGAEFRPHPDFSLQEHANITVNKTYYVDSENGDDGNSGADWDNAFETLNEAWSQADVDRIYATGQWTNNQQHSITTRDFELIGVGDCTVTCDVTDEFVGAWSSVDNHYEAAVSDYVYTMRDESDPDANCPEWGTDLDTKASIAEVDANPGSFWQDWPSRKIYVRTHDSREPDTDLRSYKNLAIYFARDNQTVYLENIKLFTGTYWRSDDVGGLKVYAKNCQFYKGLFYGMDEVIFEDCSNHCYKEGDVMDYNDRDGVTGYGIEINCDFRNISEDGPNQASTAHDGSNIVRIEGYYETGIQTIADSAETIWMLGVHANNFNDGWAFYSEQEAWLDRCYLDGELVDQDTGGTIYIRDCTITGAQSGNIQSY